MRLAISAQLAEAAASLALGAALGLCYDLLRAGRLRLRRAHWLFDGVFVLLCAFALFALSMAAPEGELRLFMLAAAALGAAAYWAALSRPVRALLALIDRLLARALGPPASFLGRIVKRGFTKASEWFTIMVTKCNMYTHAQKRRAVRAEEDAYEAEKGKYTYHCRHIGSDGLRGRDSLQSQGSRQRRQRGKGPAGG